jgi:hypothetical protein
MDVKLILWCGFLMKESIILKYIDFMLESDIHVTELQSDDRVTYLTNRYYNKLV